MPTTPAISPSDQPGGANRGGLLGEYQTEEELAADLDVSVRTLQSWRGRRIGPPWTKCGRKILYRRRTSTAWLESNEHNPARNKKAAQK